MFLWFAGFNFEIENSPSVSQWDPPYICHLLMEPGPLCVALNMIPSLNTQGLFPLVLTNSLGSESLGEIQGIIGTGQEDTFIYKVMVL